MYTDVNYKTKKLLKEAFKRGDIIKIRQPCGLFPTKLDGIVIIEGPHFPNPHSWYAHVEIKDGIIIKIRG